MVPDPKTGILLPTEGEIASAVPTEWDDEDNPFTSRTSFSRLDSNPDSVFYASPRFVEHVDENAVATMTNYNTNLLQPNDAVLDLGASWTSHLDPAQLQKLQLTKVAGLGMNEEELKANPALTEYVVQDLNSNTNNQGLPYKDNTFNVVLCQLTIDYLTKPLEVMKEVGRVLVPGGKVVILFSNRLFIQKAVGLWTGADDVDHVYTVASYLHYCKNGLFENITAQDLSTRKGRDKRIVGDPLYVVTASTTTTTTTQKK